MALLAAAFLAILSLAFMRLDRRLWGSALTPGVVLACGYSLIVLIYGLALNFYDFTEVRWTTYVVLVFFICVCMLCSIVAASALGWRKAEMLQEVQSAGQAPRTMVILTLASFLPLAIVTSLGNGGLWSTDAREAMSGGLIGHMHVALAFSTVWYAVDNRDNRWSRSALIAMALVALSLYPVKGWTLIPLTAVIFANVFRTHLRGSVWKYLPLLALVGATVFFTIYLARADFEGADFEVVVGVFSSIFEHFIFYLTAGLFGLDAVVSGLQLHGDPVILFAPFYNVLAVLTGDTLLSPISDVFVEGMGSHETGGNVFSFLGSLLGYGGVTLGAVLAFIIIVSAYLSLGLAWRLRFSSLRAAVLYGIATLSFGWFDYYFWLLTPYEVAFFAILVAVPNLRLRRKFV